MLVVSEKLNSSSRKFDLPGIPEDAVEASLKNLSVGPGKEESYSSQNWLFP